MATHRTGKTFAAVLMAAALLTVSVPCASAATSARVYVSIGPPAPVVETRVVAPGPGYVWVPGYHRWDSRAYVWVPGRWVRPPHAHAAWVPARWVHEGHHGWYLKNGHWR
jgi:hypothetical protein